MYMEFLHKRKIILVVDRCFVEGVFGPEGKASWFAVTTAEFAQSMYSRYAYCQNFSEIAQIRKYGIIP